MAPPSLQRAVAAAPPADAGPARRRAAAAGRPDARNRRTLSDIGNIVTAPVVRGEAKLGKGIKRRPIASHLSNSAADSKKAVAPRPSDPSAASKPSRKAPSPRQQQANKVARSSSNEKMKLPQGAGNAGVTSGDVKSLMKRLADAESELAEEKEKVRIGLESIREKVLLVDSMKMQQRIGEEISRSKDSIIDNMKAMVEMAHQSHIRKDVFNGILKNLLIQKEAKLQEVQARKEVELQQVKVEVQTVKAQKEAEVMKLMEENVRLTSKVDKKEALLQAMSDQLKFMALNNPNKQSGGPRDRDKPVFPRY